MTFRPNSRFTEELEATPAFRAGMAVIGQQVAHQARLVAPVGETGRYAQSFAVIQVGGVTLVTNMDFAAHLVEFGSVNNEAYAPLRQGVRRAGLTLLET